MCILARTTTILPLPLGPSMISQQLHENGGDRLTTAQDDEYLKGAAAAVNFLIDARIPACCGILINFLVTLRLRFVIFHYFFCHPPIMSSWNIIIKFRSLTFSSSGSCGRSSLLDTEAERRSMFLIRIGLITVGQLPIDRFFNANNSPSKSRAVNDPPSVWGCTFSGKSIFHNFLIENRADILAAANEITPPAQSAAISCFERMDLWICYGPEGVQHDVLACC